MRKKRKDYMDPAAIRKLFGLAGDDDCCVMYDSLFLQILLISVYFDH